ncbi:M23 family metallopeptidase [Kribbella antibiotica]|uniref:M23 family metallopeptidase n=1 Tax=Kribbella antibiotica TaxID=190195 RepID=A0A4R4ZAX9_9ACTN|nr:M23 family metallopeptidase [Kribbella antibiotica]TDD55433.1 M23 family metallopeptidase [Kribbella antibiotica]
MKLIRLALLAILVTAGLVAVPTTAMAADPLFQMPIPCGLRWTTATHSGHNPKEKLDMVDPGGHTQGTAALAAAGGRVSYSGFLGETGNLIVIDHGGGWQTRYMHLDRRDVGLDDTVVRGQQIGLVGNTGSATTGAHLHFEEKKDGVVQQVRFDGHLVPITWNYFEHYETSNNCGGPGDNRFWVDTFADAPGYASPGAGASTGTLKKGTSYVYCRAWGPEVRNGASFNHWWLKTDLDIGPANQYVSAYYLSRWGNDEAKDNAGRDIKDCT